jgi:hypothetical protein
LANSNVFLISDVFFTRLLSDIFSDGFLLAFTDYVGRVISSAIVSVSSTLLARCDVTN